MQKISTNNQYSKKLECFILIFSLQKQNKWRVRQNYKVWVVGAYVTKFQKISENRLSCSNIFLEIDVHENENETIVCHAQSDYSMETNDIEAERESPPMYWCHLAQYVREPNFVFLFGIERHRPSDAYFRHPSSTTLVQHGLPLSRPRGKAKPWHASLDPTLASVLHRGLQST